MIELIEIGTARTRICQSPYSVNSMYYATKKVKRSEFREWEASVISKLGTYSFEAELMELKTLFDPQKHAFSVSYTFLFPEAKLITKDGTISARCPDITNLEKPLQDIVFERLYNGHQRPFTWQNLDIDDKFVMRCVSEKNISFDKNHYIDVEIKLCEIKII